MEKEKLGIMFLLISLFMIAAARVCRTSSIKTHRKYHFEFRKAPEIKTLPHPQQQRSIKSVGYTLIRI